MSQLKKGKILITGASGMLGHALVDELRSQKTELRGQIIPTDINELDVASGEATQKIIDINPNLVIHLAAYTDVDGCELHPDSAFEVNSIGTRNVALACQKLDVPILYISTDYVFDGGKPTPYLEWDLPNPINTYGQTKLEGELWIKNLLNKYWILRTSWLYGERGKNFVSTIIEIAKKKKEIKVVADQIGSPTYTKDFAKAIRKLICSPDLSGYGAYHITNSGWGSWYEFAKSIIVGVQKFEPLQCNILPINSYEFKRPAKRPKNSRLFNFMWEQTFRTPLRHWEGALNEYLKNNR